MCKPNMTVTIFPDLLLPVATCESIYLFIVPTDLFNINFTFYTFLFLFFFIFFYFFTVRQVYVPTAAYCLDPRSTRPLGEQRRRARYDAKNKAKVLSESFSNCSFSLLELGTYVRTHACCTIYFHFYLIRFVACILLLYDFSRPLKQFLFILSLIFSIWIII